MADTVERLYKVTVDAAAAVRDLEKIAKAAGNIESQFAVAGRAVKALGATLVAAVAAGGIHQLAAGVLATSEAFDQLGKDAQKLGVAVEELQRLRYAADLSGVSAEQMDKAIGSLAVGMQHLGNATDDTAKILKAIGVTSGDSPSAALAKIADHFAKMPDGVAKLSEAIAIFGKKVGPDLIPWLNGGAKGLKEMTDEAARFGGVVGGAATRAAEAFNDDLAKLQRTASGVGRGITEGMLPALQALARTLTQSVTAAGGFQKIGASLGEGLITTAKGALYASQAVRSLGSSLEFLAKIRLQPTSFRASFAQLREELADINRETERAVDRLTANFLKAKREAKMPAPEPPATTDTQGLLAKLEQDEAAAKRAAKAATELHDAWEPVRKLEADIRGETADTAEAQRELNDAMAEATKLAVGITDPILAQGAAYNKAKDAIDAQIQAQADAELEMQAMIVLAEKGTEAQKALAGAWLAHELALKHMAPVVDEWKETQEILGAGFDRFVQSVSSGSVTVAQAFRGMAQSIIADLLKLLAKRAILQMFGLGGGTGAVAPPGSTGIQAAAGAAFDAGRLLPFAQGAIFSAPTRFRMAGGQRGLMAEAGAEAIMPLQRTADGALGVRAQAPAMNVAIHNHTDASVSARRNGAGDLEVIIAATKKSMAADILRGGNDVARAAESAWRLSRGAAAPF